MPANPITNSPLHSWPAYISLLFLGFFPGAFLMYAQQEPPPTPPVLLEYDLMILRASKDADASKIPDISDWNYSAIGRAMHEKGWRVLNEPKLMSGYPCQFGTYIGEIAGFDKTIAKAPEYGVRFFTKASGANLQTHVDFYSDKVHFAHNLLHLAGQTTAIPLTNGQPNEDYRYFLLFKVTTHDRFQVGAPTIAPTGTTTAP